MIYKTMLNFVSGIRRSVSAVIFVDNQPNIQQTITRKYSRRKKNDVLFMQTSEFEKKSLSLQYTEIVVIVTPEC